MITEMCNPVDPLEDTDEGYGDEKDAAVLTGPLRLDVIATAMRNDNPPEPDDFYGSPDSDRCD